MRTTGGTAINGIDGIAPIYNPGARFQIWALSEIFTGPDDVGTNKYIPNPGDYVVDTTSDTWYKVIAVDQTTFISTFTTLVAAPVGVLSANDMLLGVGPGTQSDTYRVYIDKAVLPYTLCVDVRLKVAGSAANSCIIYRGTILGDNAVAVSGVYDQAGNLLGQNIPLELVAMDGNNTSIKTVPVCHTVIDLPDGEIVTAVFYSADGNVVSKRQLLVENTAFIRSTDASVKYITGISLDSPFLSQADNTLIQYPINVPLNGLMLEGVVTYSDGSQLRLPVDGSKFSIYGFAGYIATVVGQKFNLVLKYILSSDEIVYDAQNVSGQIGGQFITAAYKATTLKNDGAFSVKLFGYPVWVDANTGYHLRWFLYTLDRKLVYDVTPHVGFNTNSPLFTPNAYGVKQTLSVFVNMQDVDPAFTAYRNVQTIDITLVAQGTARTTNWTIGFTPNQSPPYGLNNHAIAAAPASQGSGTTPWVDISLGALTQSEWLDRLYFATQPLTDPVSELVPPTPNMFAVVVNGQDVVFPLSAWNTHLDIPDVLYENTTAFIKFFLRTPNNDAQLAIAAMPVYWIVPPMVP